MAAREGARAVGDQDRPATVRRTPRSRGGRPPDRAAPGRVLPSLAQER